MLDMTSTSNLNVACKLIDFEIVFLKQSKDCEKILVRRRSYLILDPISIFDICYRGRRHDTLLFYLD